MKIFRKILIFVVLLGVSFSFEKFVPSASATTNNNTLIEENQKFRSIFGLSMDAKYINDVMSSKNANNSFGVTLTQEEADTLNKRIDTQNDLVPKLTDYLIKNEEAFSGIYVNQEEGGVIYILLADQVNNNAKREINLKTIHEDKIQVKYVNAKFTFKTLEEYNQKVTEMLTEKKVNFLSTIEVRENKIKIQIENLNQSDVDTINGILPSGSFDIKEMEAKNIDENRDLAQRPLQGGLALEDASGKNWCSSAFIAYDSNSNYYLITAAHCDSSHIQIQGGSSIGQVSSHFKRGGNTDARAVN